MTKFVEQGDYLVIGQKCWLACSRLWNVEVVTYNRKLSKKEAHKIIRDAVKIEKQFITKSLPCDLIGMNAKLMSQYIEFVADRLLLQLGYPKAYSAANPFPFMERISLENKDNFFEKKVTTYGMAGVGKDKEEMVFSTSTDF